MVQGIDTIQICATLQPIAWVKDLMPPAAGLSWRSRDEILALLLRGAADHISHPVVGRCGIRDVVLAGCCPGRGIDGCASRFIVYCLVRAHVLVLDRLEGHLVSVLAAE